MSESSTPEPAADSGAAQPAVEAPSADLQPAPMEMKMVSIRASRDPQEGVVRFERILPPEEQ
jgi:hypothetical protein